MKSSGPQHVEAPLSTTISTAFRGLPYGDELDLIDAPIASATGVGEARPDGDVAAILEKCPEPDEVKP